MKNYLRRALSLLAALMLLCGMGAPALAAGGVSYDENAEKFIFSPGSAASPTDIFPGLKNVMPGDTLSDAVDIKNPASNRHKLRVYMRALGAVDGSADFLSQLRLTVASGSTTLFAAPANETAQLTDWVYLGTLYPGGSARLDLTLSVPIELSDEYQHAVGLLDWQFKIDQLPLSPSDPSVRTGDAAHPALYAALLIASAASLTALCALKRKAEL